MIFLEEIVNNSLQEEGQIVLSLSDLGITWSDLERLFLATYNESKGYLSVYDWQTSVINTNPHKMNDITHVRHITYNAYNNMQRFLPDVPGQYWEFNPYTKNISSLMSTNFSLEVGKYPTCAKLPFTLQLNNVKKGQKVNFSLPFAIDTNLEISDNKSLEEIKVKGKEVKYASSEDCKNKFLDNSRTCICNDSDSIYATEIVGDATGSFDMDSLNGYLKFSKDYDSLTVTFNTKYVAIQELDLSCELFVTWFKAKLFTMIGAIKKQIDLQGIGLPFDFNQDELLGRGRELMAKLDELKTSKMHWSNF